MSPLEVVPAFIPSPEQGVWHLFGIPIRAYALCIIAGVIAAVWLGDRRWVARGGRSGQVADVAIVAVPFGLVGARLYHVITDHGLYFGAGSPKAPIDALKVWEGGLGIWGAIAGGVLGAWFACRHYGIRMRPLMDALAPALLLAQAIGRWGNYFNQELFGGPTTLPWGLKIDLANRPVGFEQYATFHPTFLYEALWSLGVAGLLIWIDRSRKLRPGELFAAYILGYGIGRLWVEDLRIDHASLIWGVRVNIWMSAILIIGSLTYIVISRRRPAPTVPREREAESAEELAQDEAAAEVAADAAQEGAVAEARREEALLEAADAADAADDAAGREPGT